MCQADTSVIVFKRHNNPLWHSKNLRFFIISVNQRNFTFSALLDTYISKLT